MARNYFAIEKGLQLLSENGSTGAKILFGSGAPAIEAEVGSLYLRTDTGDAYKKITVGANASDWEIFPDATVVNALITLSGVASGETDLGTFTGSIIPDDSTVKAALQALETYVESIANEVVYAEEDAVEGTAAVVDEVLVDDILACEWLLTIQLDSDTARRTTMKVVAQHDGTAAADAANVDDTVFAKVKTGAAFTNAVTVVLNGTGAAQTMQLKVAGAAGAAVSARATRIATVL